MNPAASKLIEQAKQETGLDNFGDPLCFEGLDVYAETIERNVADEQGKQRLLRIQYKKLLSRLKIFAAFERHPEILREEIKVPLFVTGLPRSGTSALLNLMASDPNNRPLTQWELRHPEPYEGLPAGEADPRYLALVEKMKTLQNSEFRKIHYADADTPEECVMMHQLSFDGVQTGFEIVMEPYASWFLQRDLHWMYNEYRDFLKILQWQRPGVRWVLKAPAHMWAIDAIVDLFPDAAFAWGHRDPVGVTASVSSMNRTVMGLYMGDTSHLDNPAIAHRLMNFYATSLERGLASRAQQPSEKFVDYNHKEFIATPVAVVQRIFSAFHFPLPDASLQALKTHIEQHPQHKHGKHDYKLEDFGLTAQDIQQRFKFYSFQDNYQ